MQPVAIARALANDPPLILADEPTGNLDSQAGQMIYELLKEISSNRTVLVVTHAEPLAQMADTVLHIRDGRLERNGYLRILRQRRGGYGARRRDTFRVG